MQLRAIVATTLICLLGPITSQAQDKPVVRSICQVVGAITVEPVGDRPGHVITTDTYSCKNDGDLGESIMTGSNIREVENGKITSLSESGVLRRQGALAVFQLTDQNETLAMADGKITGCTGVSKGVYKFASGAFVQLSGKAFTSNYHCIKGGQLEVVTKLD